MKKTSLLIAISVIFMTGCSNTLIEDYIAGSWELKTYLRNDVEETSEIKISNYKETYEIGGIYSRRYVDGKQNPVEESGKFQIDEDNMSIHISDVSSLSDFSEQHSTLSTSIINVVIIDESEFVYTFDNGGDTHEFRYLKAD